MNYKHSFATIMLLIFGVSVAIAQPDQVLFTVGGTSVSANEFKQIYAKTNQDKADFSETSLRDYLNLYTNFKLKVMKARDMRLDTIGVLKSELEGYRSQLAKSYLEDKEVTDKLIKELHERMLKDVDISHILVILDRNAPDSTKAYNRAMAIAKLVRGGADFTKVALDSSEDKSVKDNRGNLGYVTAMLPDGYYNLEKAIYSAKPGEIVGPIRSNGGYHLVRVNGFRTARGEMEVGQILVRKGDAPEKLAAAKLRIDSCYTALQSGQKWEDMCMRYSDDKISASKGGYLGFFGINRYQKSFEDAGFALTTDGEYSKPVETSIGYHIIRRISARPIGEYEKLKRGLSERVKKDGRSEVARQSMIARIKRESNCTENAAALIKWSAQQVDTVFHTFKWKPNTERSQDVLLDFGGVKKFTVADFEEYCARSGRERMSGAGLPLDKTIAKMYKTWTEESTMKYEESQLNVKYPEFKSLMREYEEGILLFEALKINVWDRANTDTVGLEKYFKTNLSQKYMWDERALVTFYTLKSDDPKLVEKLRKLASTKSPADVLKKMNKKGDLVSVIEKRYEKGKNKDLGDRWKANEMTETKVDATTKTASFIKIEAVEPPAPKALVDARGYAVADYQDYLEKQWIEELRKAYPVKLNEDVLKSLIKK